MGLYLAEIFNIVYQGQDEVKPEKQLGTIRIDDSEKVQYIYSVDCVDTTRPSILPGDEVALTGPDKAIVCYGPLTIDVDLFCGTFKGTIEFDGYPPHSLMENAPLEERIMAKDGTGELVILYALFNNAMKANVEIRLSNRDNSDIHDLHGVLAANITDFEQPAFTSFLYLKKPSCGIDVANKELIPLSRSIIAVPYKSSLSLEFHLFTGNEEFIHDFVEFRAEPGFKSVGRLSSKKGDIHIQIAWTFLRHFVEVVGGQQDGCTSEPDSNSETKIELDPDCEILASETIMISITD